MKQYKFVQQIKIFSENTHVGIDVYLQIFMKYFSSYTYLIQLTQSNSYTSIHSTVYINSKHIYFNYFHINKQKTQKKIKNIWLQDLSFMHMALFFHHHHIILYIFFYVHVTEYYGVWVSNNYIFVTLFHSWVSHKCVEWAWLNLLTCNIILF